MSKHSPLSGIILSGGRSSRMGHDKGVIDYHGKPQREFLFDVLSEFCDQVYLSCKSKSEIPEHLQPLEDQFDIDSPLNGILSAFQKNPDSAWISVPVDMPNVDAGTIEFLLRHRDPSFHATCFYDSDGKNPEPLLTVWENSAGQALLDFFTTGKISPRAFLLSHRVNIIQVPDPKTLANINSPEELQKFKGNC